MNNDLNEIVPELPKPHDGEGQEFKDTLGWVLTVMLKFGAGYLTKVILDALGL